MDHLFTFLGGYLGISLSSAILLLGIANIYYAVTILKKLDSVSNDIRGDKIDELAKSRSPEQSILASYIAAEREFSDVNKGYKKFVSFSETFPLQGILGTLVALIQYSGQIDLLQSAFATAIITTVLGISFAIFFKIMEGHMVGRIDLIRERIELYQDLYARVKFHPNN